MTNKIATLVLIGIMLVLTAFHEWLALALFLLGSFIGAMIIYQDTTH